MIREFIENMQMKMWLFVTSRLLVFLLSKEERRRGVFIYFAPLGATCNLQIIFRIFSVKFNRH